MTGNIEFPNLKGADYLIEHLQNMGYALNGFSGRVPLTYSEIESYSRLMKVDFLPAEVKLLIDMSNAFVSESGNKDPLAYAPYIDKSKLGTYDNSERLKKAFDNF